MSGLKKAIEANIKEKYKIFHNMTKKGEGNPFEFCMEHPYIIKYLSKEERSLIKWRAEIELGLNEGRISKKDVDEFRQYLDKTIEIFNWWESLPIISFFGQPSQINTIGILAERLDEEGRLKGKLGDYNAIN